MALSRADVADLEAAIDAKVAAASKPKSSRQQARVTRVDPDGTVWVHVFGGAEETPLRSNTASVEPGDVIDVTFTGLSLRGGGNASDPSASSGQVRDAARRAEAARLAAESAIESAGAAEEAAEAARGSAALASERAGAATASASQAAAQAQEASGSAASASESAATALGQLSEVERVVGTLNWIAEHGRYEPSGDSRVDGSKVYYERTGSGTEADPYAYAVVADPRDADVAGYYVLVVDESVQNYIASHLALTDEGLLVMSGAGGYRALLSNSGMRVIDPSGAVVSTFGGAVRVGRGEAGHVEITDGAIRLGYGDLTPFEVATVTSREVVSEETLMCIPVIGGTKVMVPADESHGVSRAWDVRVGRANTMSAQGDDMVGSSVTATSIVTDEYGDIVSDLPDGITIRRAYVECEDEGGNDASGYYYVVDAEWSQEVSDLFAADIAANGELDIIEYQYLAFSFAYATYSDDEPSVGDSLAVRVGGRGTIPTYKYRSKPAASALPALPCLAVVDGGDAYLGYDDDGTPRLVGVNSELLALKADASDLNAYVKKSGDTMTGQLVNTMAGRDAISVRHGEAGIDACVNACRTDTGVGVNLMVGSGGVNHGIWSDKLGKWILYADASSVYINGTNTSNLSLNGHTHSYLPLSGGTINGNNAIVFSGNSRGSIYAGPNDAANGFNGALNNLVIHSWYGVSFTSSCSGTYQNKTTVGINARNGHVYMNGMHANAVYFRTVLYNNATGTTGTVTLSQTAANFNHMRIYFRTSDSSPRYSSLDVYSPNGKLVGMVTTYSNSSAGNIKVRTATISGTSITNNGGYEQYANAQGFGNFIYITRVEAWNE